MSPVFMDASPAAAPTAPLLRRGFCHAEKRRGTGCPHRATWSLILACPTHGSDVAVELCPIHLSAAYRGRLPDASGHTLVIAGSPVPLRGRGRWIR